MENEKPKITAQNLSSLASLYKVSRKTMKFWLKKGNLYKDRSQGYLYTPKEVRKIYEHLGNL